MIENNKNKKKKKYLAILAILLLSGTLVGATTAIIMHSQKNNKNPRLSKPSEDIGLLDKLKNLKNDLEGYKNSLVNSGNQSVNDISNLIEEVKNIIEIYSNKNALNAEDKGLLNKKYNEFIISFNNIKYKNNKSELDKKIDYLEKEIFNSNNSETNNNSSLDKIIEELNKTKEEFNKLPNENINNDSETNRKVEELNNKIDNLIKEFDFNKNNNNNKTSQEDLELEKGKSSIVIKDSSSLDDASSLTTNDFEVFTTSDKKDNFVYEVTRVTINNNMDRVIVEAKITAKDNDNLTPVIISNEFNLEKNNFDDSLNKRDELIEILKNATVEIKYVGEIGKSEIYLPSLSSEEIKKLFEVVDKPLHKRTNKIIDDVISSIIKVESSDNSVEITVLIKSLIYPDIFDTVKVIQTGFKDHLENIQESTEEEENLPENTESSNSLDSNTTIDNGNNSKDENIEVKEGDGNSDRNKKDESEISEDNNSVTTDHNNNSIDNTDTSKDENLGVVGETTVEEDDNTNSDGNKKDESEISGDNNSATTDQNNNTSLDKTKENDNDNIKNNSKDILEEAVKKVNNLTVIRVEFQDETKQNLYDAKNILSQESPTLESITLQTNSINDLLNRMKLKEYEINNAAAEYNEALSDYDNYMEEYKSNQKAIWEINEILTEAKRQYKLFINNPYITVEKINELKNSLINAKEKVVKKQMFVERYAKEIIDSYETWINSIKPRISSLNLNELQTFKLINNHYESFKQEYDQLFLKENLTRIQDIIDLEGKIFLLTLNYEVEDVIKIEDLMYVIKNDSDYKNINYQQYRNRLDKTMTKLESLISNEINKLSNDRFNKEESIPSFSYYLENLTNEFKSFKNDVSKTN